MTVQYGHFNPPAMPPTSRRETLPDKGRGARTLAAGLGLAALAACAAPGGPRPQLEDTAALASQRSLAAPAADWPADRWWDAYGDPQLSSLIDEALARSPTLAEAEARARSAGAAAQVTRAGLAPQISADGAAEAYEQSREIGFPPFIADLLPRGYQGEGRVALDFGYDLDLFGKNRAALAAAVSEEAAARADAAEARLVLSAAVADAYGDLMRLGAERSSAEEALRNRQEIGRLTGERVANGLDTRAELRQAQAAVPASGADVEALDEQVELTRHRIAALLGAGPDRGLSIVIPTAEKVRPFGLPADIRLHLIGRRPDIVAARMRAEAAARRIAVAKAQFYPDISLTGYVGQQALGLGNLVSPAAAIGSFGPAITLPIFEGGRLRGQLKGARADYAAAVDAYDNTLVQALRDVGDAAASVKSAERQLAERRAALEAGQQGYAVAEERYRGGLSSYVAVLAAENAVIEERRQFADAQSRAFSLDIALVRALGGGYGGA